MINKKIGIIIASLGLFLIIGVLVVSNTSTGFDHALQSIIFNMRKEPLTVFFKIITYSANWQTISLLSIMFLALKRTRISVGIPLSLASIISIILYEGAKMLYTRSRPDMNLHLIEQGGFSFPSGHSMTGLVFYGLIIYFVAKYAKENRAQKALMSILGILIFLIGLSRVYLGVHYPTDVIAGWLLGTCVLASVLIILEKGYLEKNKFYKSKLQ